MAATRSALSVGALWATLCVVVLAAGWLSDARASVPLAPPVVALSVTAWPPTPVLRRQGTGARPKAATSAARPAMPP